MKSKKIIIAIASVVLTLALAEVGMWVADSRWDFRRQLLEVLASAERVDEPLGPQAHLPWEDRMILIRLPVENAKESDRVYTVGNREIPEANYALRQHRTFPETIASIQEKRVFIIGGSAAFGLPYPMHRTFASMLGGLVVQDGYVVLNASQPAWSTGELVPLARRVVDLFEPDTIVIMAGNNEFMHWLDDEQPWVDERIISACRAVAGSRLMAGLLYWSMKRSLHGRTEQDISGYEYALECSSTPYTKERVKKWVETKQKFIDMYAFNLAEMSGYAKERGVRVILCTMPFNYRLPVSWKHPQPESCVPENADKVIGLVHEAAEALEQGEKEKAVKLADEALALDPNPPILHYLKAEALRLLGRNMEAERSYEQAREHMVGNLGSVLSINNAVMAVGRAEGVPVLDVKTLFDDWSHANNSYFNEHLVHDDCHPTPRGHELIAKALAEIITASRR